MNKYVFGVLIKDQFKAFGGNRIERFFVETDLILNEMEDFEYDEFPREIVRLISGLGVKNNMSVIERIVGYKVEKYNEPKIQKIEFGDEEKFNMPKEYNAFKINYNEILISAKKICFLYNKTENTIKKVIRIRNYKKLEDNFQKIDFDISTIPENVIYL